MQRRRTVRLLAAVSSAVALAAPAPSFALCWIKRVEKTTDGVTIFFGQPAPVLTSRGYFSVDPNAQAVAGLSDRADPPRPVRAISARLGDTLSISFGPENGCGMTVAVHDGQVGVESEVGIHYPGPPPVEQHEFIPAVDPGR